MPLQDYKDIVGAIASFVTLGQFLAGVFICRDIVKAGDTKNVQALPFIGGIGISALFFKYATIINEPGMIPINIVGAILNIGYLTCYYLYTSKKADLIYSLIKATVFFGSILLYSIFEDPEKLEFRYGMIVTALMFVLIASPFAQLGEVIRTGSTESLPFPMILSGTFVSLSWLLYGVIIEDNFTLIQNFVALLLSAGQLSLFVIYPRKSSAEKKKRS